MRDDFIIVESEILIYSLQSQNLPQKTEDIRRIKHFHTGLSFWFYIGDNYFVQKQSFGVDTLRGKARKQRILIKTIAKGDRYLYEIKKPEKNKRICLSVCQK